MQTLIFNTANKTVKLYREHPETSEILFQINDVPTVKIEKNFYEVYQLHPDSFNKPVLRLPISNTIMLLQHS